MKAALIDLGDVDAGFESDWRALEAAAGPRPNPYFASWFLPPAMRAFGPSVRLLTVRNDAGALVFLAPVAAGDRFAKAPVRHFSIWRHPHAYNGAPLVAAADSDGAWEAVGRWIDSRPEGARFLRLTDFPDAPDAPGGRESVVQAHWRRAALSGGQAFEAAFAQGFAGKKRKELRRQFRRLGEQGDVNFHRYASPDEIAAAAADYVELELSGWKGRRDHATPIGASEEERAFFQEAMTTGARAGAVVCDALTLAGKPIAMMFSLRLGDTLSAYKISYNEAFAQWSPGVQLLVEAMRRMLEDRSIAFFDSCAREGHPVVDHLWRERRDVREINIPARGAANVALLKVCAAVDRANRRVSASMRNAGGGA